MIVVTALLAVFAVTASVVVLVALRHEATSLCCTEHGEAHEWQPAFAKPGRARVCRVCGVRGIGDA